MLTYINDLCHNKHIKIDTNFKIFIVSYNDILQYINEIGYIII